MLPRPTPEARRRRTFADGFRAFWALAELTFRRQFWTAQVLAAVLLIALLGCFVLLRSLFQMRLGGSFGWPDDLGFSRFLLLEVYVGFLLPILCLCFGTQSIGGDWEEGSLVWLLTRPLPRPLIYLAKFAAAVPWTFGLTLGGMALLGLLAGRSGVYGFVRFWPAVAWGTLAYLALFVLMGACFRRSTVVAVVYAFVIESIIGNMPGMVKRGSVSFYSRCVFYDLGAPDLQPENPSLFLAVEGSTAVQVLALAAAAAVLLGMWVFSRREYSEAT